jgi:hypothetical protein
MSSAADGKNGLFTERLNILISGAEDQEVKGRKDEQVSSALQNTRANGYAHDRNCPDAVLGMLRASSPAMRMA